MTPETTPTRWNLIEVMTSPVTGRAGEQWIVASFDTETEAEAQRRHQVANDERAGATRTYIVADRLR